MGDSCIANKTKSEVGKFTRLVPSLFESWCTHVESMRLSAKGAKKLADIVECMEEEETPMVAGTDFCFVNQGKKSSFAAGLVSDKTNEIESLDAELRRTKEELHKANKRN